MPEIQKTNHSMALATSKVKPIAKNTAQRLPEMLLWARWSEALSASFSHLARSFARHRIGDERVVRLILKWMKGGVMEYGKRAVNRRYRPDRVRALCRGTA